MKRVLQRTSAVLLGIFFVVFALPAAVFMLTGFLFAVCAAYLVWQSREFWYPDDEMVITKSRQYLSGQLSLENYYDWIQGWDGTSPIRETLSGRILNVYSIELPHFDSRSESQFRQRLQELLAAEEAA